MPEAESGQNMMKRVRAVVVWGLLVAMAAVVGYGGGTLWCRWDSSAPAANTGGLPQQDAGKRLEEYVAAHVDVLSRLPEDSKARAAYEEAVLLASSDLKCGAGEAAKHIVRTYANLPLGLYALDRLTSSREAEDAAELSAFCRELCTTSPDARVACMAFEKLQAMEPKAAEEVKKTHLAQPPASRLACFIYLSEGDSLARQKDMARAAEHWLMAWLAEPERGRQVGNKLFRFWEERREWMYTVLLPAEFVNDPALNPIKKSALDALIHPGDLSTDCASGLELFRTVGRLLEGNQTKEAIENLRQGLERVRAGDMSSLARVEFGVAAFLIGSDKIPVSANPADTLALQQLLTACRADYLEVALAAMPEIPGDLQALLLMRISARYLEDAQAVQALDVLRGGWENAALPRAWRDQLVDEYCTLLARERGEYMEAASVLKQYHDQYPSAGDTPTVKAGLYLHKALQWPQARREFEKLVGDEHPVSSRALAFYMIGQCYWDEENYPEARQCYYKVFDMFPGSEFGPNAAYQIASCHLMEHDVTTAKKWFETLLERYPSSRQAEHARVWLERNKED